MAIDTQTSATATVDVEFELQQLLSVLDREGISGLHCAGCSGCSGCAN